MKPAAFAYRRPDNVGEAVAVLNEHGDECRVIAGGQSLGAMLNMRLVTPRVLLDINGLKELGAIVETSNTLRIGAIARQADVLRAAPTRHARLLQLALPNVGHYQTRNRGTVGGSIAHADPSAELPLALLVGGGSVELRSKRGSRQVEAENFFVSNLTTQRRPDELLTAIHWSRSPAGSGEAFAEFATRSGDYAIVAAACRVEMRSDGKLKAIRLGFSGVHERPVLADTASASGQEPLPKTAQELAQHAAARIETVSDFHASAAFRSNLVKVLGLQVLTQAFEAANAERAHA